MKNTAGKTMNMTMRPSDTIDHFIGKLEYEWGIYRDRVDLFASSPLDKSKTLSAQRVRDSATLHFVVNSRGSDGIMQIFVAMASCDGIMHIIDLEAEASDTIGQLKTKLAAACTTKGIRFLSFGNQRLIFAGKRLTDDRTLWDCGIQDGSFLLEDEQHLDVVIVDPYL